MHATKSPFNQLNFYNITITFPSSSKLFALCTYAVGNQTICRKCIVRERQRSIIELLEKVFEHFLFLGNRIGNTALQQWEPYPGGEVELDRHYAMEYGRTVSSLHYRTNAPVPQLYQLLVVEVYSALPGVWWRSAQAPHSRMFWPSRLSASVVSTYTPITSIFRMQPCNTQSILELSPGQNFTVPYQDSHN